MDEWAEPVGTDNAEMAALRPMLKNTNLEFRGLKLTYSANRDGWNAKSFHKKVDKLGGALVVCTTSDGLVCGGCKYPHRAISRSEPRLMHFRRCDFIFDFAYTHTVDLDSSFRSSHPIFHSMHQNAIIS